jgi:CBS domain containing-hemolysin-like protein
MLADIIGIFLVGIALIALALQRFYSSVPAKELKRLAARGEQVALVLYRPVAYGTSLRVLLWLIAGICMPIGFFLIVEHLSLWAALLIMIAALGASVVWLPSKRLTWRNAKCAVWAAPVLDRALHYLHPFLDRIAAVINSHRGLVTHSGLYEKEDLHALLAQQQAQEDNRIAVDEIELLQRAMRFNDTKAMDVASSRKDAYLVSTSDSLGPVLLDELHKSKQPYFAVYRGTKENIVGTLSMKAAASSKHGGHVADIIQTDVCFVNEDCNLVQIAQAFVATSQHVAVVINKFEEFVGLITFDQLLHSLFVVPSGSPAESPAYDDRAAIAAYDPQAADLPIEAPEPEETSPEGSEVVE